MGSPTILRARFPLLVLFAIAAAILAGAAVLTKIPRPVTPPPPLKIKTEFVADAQLSRTEIDRLLLLAKYCGVHDVAKITTFHFIPGGGRGISVSSKERVDGRSTYFDVIDVARVDWVSIDPQPDSQRLSPFWCRGKMRTEHLREFIVGKQQIRLTIGDGVDATIADMVIAELAAQLVSSQPQTALNRGRFAYLRIGEAQRILKNRTGDGYDLWFGRGGGEIVHFKVQNGKVIITGSSFYAV